MKKVFKNILLTLLTVVALVLSTYLYIKTDEYKLNGTVISVFNEHWVMVKTSDGNIYEFDGYDYKEGQKVQVVLRAMDTKSKDDDVIVKVF